MGIDKLWEILSTAAEAKSLLRAATLDGFKVNNRGLRAMIIGVDISIRINAIVAALSGAGVFNPGLAGQKLILEKLFYQLCQYSCAPVILVFVFDGPGRPPIKRGTRVIYRPAWFEQHLKVMITAFGYYYYDAPGEAEAELAQLNKEGKIDAVITEDSDALVFGAKCVIRAPGSCVTDDAVFFTADAIQTTVSLDEGGLLLCALILGGDYDAGLVGAGAAVAVALARGGFGRSLIRILRSFKGTELRHHLNTWRVKLRQELRTNSLGWFVKRQPKLADTIPNTFPNPQVAELYLNPLTSRFVGFAGAKPNTHLWESVEPSIRALSEFCSAQFGWNGAELLKKLNSNLWPGVAFRMISSPYVLYDTTDKNRFLSRSTKAQLLKKFSSKSTSDDASALSLYRVRVSTEHFIHSAALGGFPQTPQREIKLVSVPKVILAVAMRDLALASTDLSHVPSSSSSSGSNLNSDQSSDVAAAGVADAQFEKVAIEGAYQAMSSEGIISAWEF